MQLIHTSPNEITEINSFGRFGEFLFFICGDNWEPSIEYVMTAGEYVVYRTEVDEDDIIEAGRLFYHDDAEKLDGLVQAVMDLTGCDEDTAEELIAQNTDVHSIDCDIEPEDLAEAGWDIQRITGEAAAILGYRGVEMEDEQGSAYLINMKGREADLEIA